MDVAFAKTGGHAAGPDMAAPGWTAGITSTQIGKAGEMLVACCMMHWAVTSTPGASGAAFQQGPDGEILLAARAGGAGTAPGSRRKRRVKTLAPDSARPITGDREVLPPDATAEPRAAAYAGSLARRLRFAGAGVVGSGSTFCAPPLPAFRPSPMALAKLEREAE